MNNGIPAEGGLPERRQSGRRMDDSGRGWSWVFAAGDACPELVFRDAGTRPPAGDERGGRGRISP